MAEDTNDVPELQSPFGPKEVRIWHDSCLERLGGEVSG